MLAVVSLYNVVVYNTKDVAIEGHVMMAVMALQGYIDHQHLRQHQSSRHDIARHDT